MFETYLQLSADHALALAFVQFAILGTLGEVLSLSIRQGRARFPFTPAKALLKILGWGLLGVYIKYMFSTAGAGLEAMVAHGYLPAFVGNREGTWNLLVNALALSTVLNVFLGPSMMILHRVMDNAMDRLLDGRDPGWQGLDRSIRTLIWLWIPLHTFTFTQARDVRIGIAAVLSLVLGVVMGAFGRRQLRSRAA